MTGDGTPRCSAECAVVVELAHAERRRGRYGGDDGGAERGRAGEEAILLKPLSRLLESCRKKVIYI